MSKHELKNVREQGLDKFYTLPSISKQCIDYVSEIYDFSNFNLVIEPSAGNGSFLNQIPSEKKIGLDISPEHENIIQQDFFTYSPQNVCDSILVIGNPPFGRVCSTAIKFFNHAANWSNVIAFIIPRTFKKSSVINKLNSHFHLIFCKDLPTNPCCFYPNMMVKCCFQIWEKKNIERPQISLPTKHEHWDFLPLGPLDTLNQPTPPNGADFAIRAYGGKIGEIKNDNLHLLRPKSWHWIKTNIDKNILINIFKKLDYSNSLNTARQNSMGKAELIQLYNDFINSKPE
jgi:hypothetical protein